MKRSKATKLINKYRKEDDFIQCECHGEGLIISDDYDIFSDNDSFDNIHNIHYMMYIALWSYGQQGKRLGIYQRLRWCWNILKKGLPWCDCVVLHIDALEKLCNSLNIRLKNAKKVWSIQNGEEKD